jgi:hypothetical protein
LGKWKKESREAIQRGDTIQQRARESHVLKPVPGFSVPACFSAVRK